MIEKLHDQIVTELAQNSRTDTVFVVAAVIFNLVVLAINSGAAQSYGGWETTLIFGIFLIVTILINTAALIALMKGRSSRVRLLEGLIEIYKDNDVHKYYPEEMLSAYETRYLLFAGMIFLLGFTAVSVPIILFIS